MLWETSFDPLSLSWAIERERREPFLCLSRYLRRSHLTPSVTGASTVLYEKLQAENVDQKIFQSNSWIFPFNSRAPNKSAKQWKNGNKEYNRNKWKKLKHQTFWFISSSSSSSVAWHLLKRDRDQRLGHKIPWEVEFRLSRRAQSLNKPLPFCYQKNKLLLFLWISSIKENHLHVLPYFRLVRKRRQDVKWQHVIICWKKNNFEEIVSLYFSILIISTEG